MYRLASFIALFISHSLSRVLFLLFSDVVLVSSLPLADIQAYMGSYHYYTLVEFFLEICHSSLFTFTPLMAVSSSDKTLD